MRLTEWGVFREQSVRTVQLGNVFLNCWCSRTDQLCLQSEPKGDGRFA